MDHDAAVSAARLLLARTETTCLTTLGLDGVPRTRAMLNLHHPGNFPGQQAFLATQDPWTVWFTTNLSSAKVAQIQAQPAASAYFCLPGEWTGLLLGGRAAVVTDPAVKQGLWQPSWTMYYGEDGVDSADYAIVALEADFAELYGNLSGARWTIDRP